MLKKILVLIFILYGGFLSAEAETISVFKKATKQGLTNQEGIVLIPAIYDSLVIDGGHSLSKSQIILYKEGDSWGLIKSNNKKITKPLYRNILQVRENRYIVEKKLSSSFLSTYGLINQKGKIILPFNFLIIEQFGDFLIGKKRTKDSIETLLFDLNGQLFLTSKELKYLGDNHFSVLKGKGLKSLYLADKNTTINLKAEDIQSFKGDKALFSQNGFLGQVNKEGEVSLKPNYKSIDTNGSKQSFKEWDVYSLGDKKTISYKADSIKFLTSGFINLYRNEAHYLYTLANKCIARNVKIVSSFQNKLAVAVSENRQYGIINEAGTWKKAPQYTLIKKLESGNYFSSKKTKDGYELEFLDKSLKHISRNRFDDYYLLSEKPNVFAVKKNALWGALASNSKPILPCKYDSLFTFGKNYFKVSYWGKQAYVDSLDQWLVMPHRGELNLDGNGNYLLANYFGNYILDAKGREIFFTYNPLYYYKSLYLEQKYDSTVRIVKPNGKYLNNVFYDKVEALKGESSFLLLKDSKVEIFNKSKGVFSSLENGTIEVNRVSNSAYVPVKSHGKYGLLNQEGDLVITNRYDGIREPSEKLIAVKLKEKWGFIDKNENIIIQPWFTEVSTFNKGLVVVNKKGLFGIYNEKGREVIPLEYQKIDLLKSGAYLCVRNGKFGYLNNKAQFVLHPIYDEIRAVGVGLITKRHGKYALSSFSGLELAPPIYKNLKYDTLNEMIIGEK